MASEDNSSAQDGALRTSLGHTRHGEPLSVNRAPIEELSPWIARIYATDVVAEPNHVTDCGMCADTPVLRILFKGTWSARTRDGFGRYKSCALFFGPQTRRMPVSVKGSFATLEVALKPGALINLQAPKVTETLDRIILYDHIYGNFPWGTSAQLIEWFGPEGPPERWMRVAEKLFTQLINLLGNSRPDPIIEEFDRAAFADPNMAIGDFARDHGVEARRLERLVKRAYGQTPKQVLRRARALDMAAQLRGVGDEGEGEELALRYYDQSHMIRDFTNYFGMTPRQFIKTPQPLMTMTLEARQARRLEVLGRHAPGDTLPWRNDPGVQPGA